jgi:hypothetical protein
MMTPYSHWSLSLRLRRGWQWYKPQEPLNTEWLYVELLKPTNNEM